MLKHRRAADQVVSRYRDKGNSEARQIEVQQNQQRVHELTRAQSEGLWSVKVLSGGQDAPTAYESAALLCSAVDLGTAGHALMPSRTPGALTSTLAMKVEPVPEKSIGSSPFRTSSSVLAASCVRRYGKFRASEWLRLTDSTLHPPYLRAPQPVLSPPATLSRIRSAADHMFLLVMFLMRPSHPLVVSSSATRLSTVIRSSAAQQDRVNLRPLDTFSRPWRGNNHPFLGWQSSQPS